MKTKKLTMKITQLNIVNALQFIEEDGRFKKQKYASFLGSTSRGLHHKFSACFKRLQRTDIFI